MELTITNRKELNEWFEAQREAGCRSFRSVKGDPPPGATYADREPLVGKVNVKWLADHGQAFDIIYAKE